MTSDYETLIATARQNPDAVDFAGLRQAYIDSEAYKPMRHFSQAKLRGNTNAAESFDEVVIYCKKFRDYNPMDLEVWMMLEYCYDQLEQFDLAVETHRFIDRMLGAIRASGDGQSPKTAWELVARAEVYTLISIMGLKTINEELLEKDGCYYAVVSCVPRADVESEAVQLCFDITAPHRHFLEMIE